MKKLTVLILMLILALSMVSLVACGGDDDEGDGGGGATQQPTAAATPDDESTPPDDQVTDEPATEEPTQQPTGDSGSSELGNLDDLKSYRMHMVGTTEMPGMPAMELEMDMAVVNDPPPQAKHIVMPDPSGMGMGDMEIIMIGDTTWIKMGDSWMESTDPGSSTQEPTDITEYLDIDSDMDYLGTETVNGVKCKHYDVDADIRVSAASPQGGTMEVSAHYVGEVWIADEGGLPEIMIRSKGTTEMESQGQTIVSEDQIDVTDINEPISITPPPADQITDTPDFGSMLDDMGDFNPEDFMPE